MQRISESAESLFGDLHKPFSTASVIRVNFECGIGMTASPQ
jgi:hypothetical protein